MRARTCVCVCVLKWNSFNKKDNHFTYDLYKSIKTLTFFLHFLITYIHIKLSSIFILYVPVQVSACRSACTVLGYRCGCTAAVRPVFRCCLRSIRLPVTRLIRSCIKIGCLSPLRQCLVILRDTIRWTVVVVSQANALRAASPTVRTKTAASARRLRRFMTSPSRDTVRYNFIPFKFFKTKL